MNLSTGWWPPQDSGQWAAWAQAAAVAVTVLGGGVWNGYLTFARRHDRQQAAEVAARAEPGRVIAWAALPRNHARLRGPQLRLAISGSSGGPAEIYEQGAWVVDGEVINGADTVVWDVVATLVTPEGERIPVPAVGTGCLVPGEGWPLAWYMRRTVTGYAGPNTDIGPSPLPAPRLIVEPSARPMLRVYFTDSTGRRWSRAGDELRSEEREAGELTGPEQSYSRGLELLAGVASDVAPPKSARGHLLQALNEAIEMTTGRPNLRFNDAASYLADARAEWTIKSTFTEAGQNFAVLTIAGAFNELAENATVGTSEGTMTMQRADQLDVDHLSQRVCALLVSLHGLTVPDGADRLARRESDTP